jgi:hypothetical protein
MANALHKPLTPSAELAAVIGPGPHTRVKATSKLWDYIKQNGRQNPEDRREIVADAGAARALRDAGLMCLGAMFDDASLLNAGVPDCIPRVTARPLVVAQTIAFYLDLLIPQMVTACEPLPLPIRREANNTHECLDLLRHSLREERLHRGARAQRREP